MSDVRYDLSPIRNYTARKLGKTYVGDLELARQLGVSESRVRKAKKSGLDDPTCDLWCVRLGITPWELYDEWVSNAHLVSD